MMKNHILSFYTPKIYPALSLLLLIGIIYAAVSFLTPPSYDDWRFMAEWTDVNGSASPSFSSFLNFWKEIRLYDNGRLANTISPLFMFSAPWSLFFNILTGLAVAFIVGMAVVFSFGRNRLNILFISLCWAAILLFLPWRNAIFVTDYSLNYIWAAAVNIGFMASIIFFEKKGWNLFSFIFVLFLAFFAAAWHEGFAFPTLCGFLLFTIVRRGRFSVQWYLIGIFFTFTAFAFAFSPGIVSRAGREFAIASTGQSLIKICFDFLPVIFLALLVALCALVSSLRPLLIKAWNNKWFVIGCGIILSGTVLSLVFSHQPRSAFWPNIMAIVMIFILSKPFWVNLDHSQFRNYFTSLLLVCCLLPMFFTLLWQARLFKESKIIINKIETSDSGTVFHDIIKDKDIPFITLKMTNYPAWITEFNFRALKSYYQKPYIAVIPTELDQNMTNTAGIKLDGNMEARKIGNSIISTKNYAEPSVFPVVVKLSDNSSHEGVATVIPYLSPDNIPLAYIYIHNISVDDIKGITE